LRSFIARLVKSINREVIAHKPPGKVSEVLSMPKLILALISHGELYRRKPVISLARKSTRTCLRYFYSSTAEQDQGSSSHARGATVLPDSDSVSIPRLVYENLSQATKDASPSIAAAIDAAKPVTEVDIRSKLKDLKHANNHRKILAIWNDEASKEELKAIIDFEIFEILLSAADKVDLQTASAKMILFYASSFKRSVLHSEMRQCFDLFGKLKLGWLYAARLLSSISAQPQLRPAGDFAPYYIEAANMCSRFGKWRTCLDVMKMALADNVLAVLKVALIACCKANAEGKAALAAYGIFQLMVSRSYARDVEVYDRLLHALNREKFYERANFVWLQLSVDASIGSVEPPEDGVQSNISFRKDKRRLAMTDALYASRIVTLFGMKERARAIDFYKSVAKKTKNPIISFLAICSELRHADDVYWLKEIEESSNLKYSASSAVPRHIARLLKEGDFKAAATYVTRDLDSSDLQYASVHQIDTLLKNLMSRDLYEDAIELVARLLSSDAAQPEMLPSNATLAILQVASSWTIKLMETFEKKLCLEEAFVLASRYIT
jgi:hypothetical protein